MFGLFRKSAPVEVRQEIDVGTLYSQFYEFGQISFAWMVSPAVIVASLSVGDGSENLVIEGRRLARTSPLLTAYLRCMEQGVLCGEPEPPVFADSVPEATAEAAAALWMRAHDIERERALLMQVAVDGELLVLDDGQVIPADAMDPVLTGPDWRPVVTGYRIGRAPTVRRSGYLYLGDRLDGQVRAMGWIAAALPYAAALQNTRIAAGHGLGALAKLAAVIENASPDRIVAGTGYRPGVVQDQPNNAAGHVEAITRTGVGSVPYMRPGEAVKRIMAGPDAVAQAYESILERDAAAALNLPLSELRSDYSSGSFSNLRMAWQDAEREYARRRRWWHRHYRLPLWQAVLSGAFADRRLPRMAAATLDALRNPTWPGPKREPPQPEKEAASLAVLVKEGILDPAQAREKLEQ